MDWKKFGEKYKAFSDEFNAQDFEERCRVSRLMTYEAIRELIRAKGVLQDAIDKIDSRISRLTPELDMYLVSKDNPLTNN